MKLRSPIVAPKFLAFLSRLNGFNIAGYFFFPWIFINRPLPDLADLDYPKWTKTVRHESIHWQQCVETLIIGFLVIYLVHYLINLIRYQKHYTAYKNVCFEAEAYANEKDDTYHYSRVSWAWMGYFNGEE